MNKILKAYRDSATLATKDLSRNWIIIVASTAAYFVYLFTLSIFGNTGFVGGFIIGMAQIVLLTYFYSWISDTVSGDKLTLEDLKQFNYPIFSNLISVAFIIFIAQFIVQSSIQGLNSNQIMLFLNLAIVFIFNPIPEVVVINRIESLPALKEALEFTRDNLIAWFIPIIAIVAPLLFAAPQFLIVSFARSEVLLPAATVFQIVTLAINVSYLNVAFALILSLWFTLFRMHLFKRLS